jgi:hypothetical protein
MELIWALRRCECAMTSATKGSQRARCLAPTAVNAGEWLASITGSDDTHLESGRPVCELLAGHDGSHFALVATAHGGDQWWWLRWDGQLGETFEVIQIDPCPAELPQARYPDDCHLPDGHPGPHSFHLPPLPSLHDGRHPVRPRLHTQ